MDFACLEFFAGAGGLSLGLEKAGFNHIALIEKDLRCCETIRGNRPNWRVLQEDVSKVNYRQFKGVDLVVGGGPLSAL